MGCACKGRARTSFVWTGPVDPQTGEPPEPIVYTSEIQAKAAVMRKGGSYTRQ